MSRGAMEFGGGPGEKKKGNWVQIGGLWPGKTEFCGVWRGGERGKKKKTPLFGKIGGGGGCFAEWAQDLAGGIWRARVGVGVRRWWAPLSKGGRPGQGGDGGGKRKKEKIKKGKRFSSLIARIFG